MNKSRRIKMLAALVPVAMVSLFAASNVQAACTIPSGNFGLTLSVNTQTNCVGSFASDTAQGFFDKLSSAGLSSLSTGYTGTQAAWATGSFNTLSMVLAFPTAVVAGSTAGNTITLDIPGLTYSKSFTGATRDASKDLLVDDIKKGNILGRIMQYQAANSPVSPISGPGGMIPSVAASDFNANFTDSATNIAAPRSVAAGATSGSVTPNLVGVGLSYGSLDVLNSKIQVISLPLSYTIRNDIDPRRQLTFSLPLTQIDTNGAKSYVGGLGISYRLPMNDNWTLTPSGKYSIVGSADMATVSSLYTVALTSTYIWAMSGFDMAMGNMVGYNKTGKFSAGDYSFDPGITNTVFRNGLMLSQPVVWGGSKLSVEYSIIDTRYTGSAMYVDNTQEFGISVGTNKSAFSARSFFRAGASYIQGRDTKGFNLNLGYWF